MRHDHNVASLCDGLQKHKRKCIIMRHRCSPGRNLLGMYRISAVLSLPYFICLSHLFYGKRSTKLSTSPPFNPAEELLIKLDLISESILLAGIMANMSPVELLLVCSEKHRSTACQA